MDNEHSLMITVSEDYAKAMIMQVKAWAKEHGIDVDVCEVGQFEPPILGLENIRQPQINFLDRYGMRAAYQKVYDSIMKERLQNES